MLIAQESTYYGIDLYGERKLKDLLEALSEVKGLEWYSLTLRLPFSIP